MSSNEDEEESDLERIVRHPVAWAVGGVVSVFTVIGSIIGDPTGTIVTVFSTMIDLAMPIFTATSIAGFTLAPEIPQIPARGVQIIAIIFGLIVVALIADRVWDSIKERVTDD